MSANSKDNNHVGTSSNDLRFNDDGFELFFKQHFVPLCSYCQYKFGFDLDLAKEIVQTSFIKLWEVRQSLTNDMSPKAYLYTIIINSSLDVLKHEKVKQQHIQFVQKTMTEESSFNSFESINLKELRA